MSCSRNTLDSYYIFPASSLENEAFNNMHKKTADHESAVFVILIFLPFQWQSCCIHPPTCQTARTLYPV